MFARSSRTVFSTVLALALTACAAPTTPTQQATATATVPGASASVQPISQLASWNAGSNRDRIVDFVRRVTTPGSPDFVAPVDRLAVFDNDGTLWAEKPQYPSVFFYFDRIRELAPANPTWRDDKVLRAIIDRDDAALANISIPDILRIATLAETGVSQEEFRAYATRWLATAKHPVLGRPYTQLVYQPMLELLDYLRANGFKTYISTGAFEELTRVLAPVYGIAPEQVIASRWKMRFETTSEGTRVVRLPEVDFYNNTANKPVSIEQFLGRRPILTVGNSDGDLGMMAYTADRKGPSLAILIDHDDAAREYQYTAGAERVVTQATQRGWVTVSMRRDWRTVYPPAR
ncbi:haloacid dehalogenase-like hydrolase [Pigmentiphaga aceris]|uniref:Haloacid dehalogenase-like hydrolase n=1 Tax=Pigmentiphaga aceris TaxID=1940612 RepID=A0A5C0AWF9_9BURK|nr:HAD family hydrolase [Pigmentiphaga aceris]QEI06086.1 haloacid dehalogenase-like hydrolase [Pigmentiphaga aceris]